MTYRTVQARDNTLYALSLAILEVSSCEHLVAVLQDSPADDVVLQLGLTARAVLQDHDLSQTIWNAEELVQLQDQIDYELERFADEHHLESLLKLYAIKKPLTRIPANNQDMQVGGNFANWGTTTIETGLVINNNNGGTVSGPALQVASFTGNQALLVTTTAGVNVLQISTNPTQPALSIANSSGGFLSVPAGGLAVNGAISAVASSGTVITATGNATAPAMWAIGNSTTTAPALRLTNNPPSASTDALLTIDSNGNVKQSTSTLGNGAIVNGGQAGPLTIGTTNATGINFISNSTSYLSLLQNGNTIVTGSLGVGTSSPITQFEVVQTNPILTSSAATGTGPYGVFVQGRYAYVPSRTSNLLQIFDVSNNPTSPTLVGSITTGLNQPYSVDVEGHYAYVVNFGGNTLQVFDVANPSVPTLVGTSATTGLNQPIWVSVQGRYAYVSNAGGNTIQIFDVANPTAPVSISSIATRSTQPRVIVAQGRYVYVTEFAGALEVFDVSNPSQPISAGYATAGFEATGLYVQGRYAYVTNFGANALQIFDVSNPTNPTLVGTATGLVDPVGISVQGRYAYVLNSIGSGTLQIFDVSTPSVPVSVGLISAGSADPLNLFVQGRYAYFTSAGTGSGANTLQVIDLGGAYIQQLEAGSLEVGTLQTRENMTVNNDLDVVGGAIFGQGFQSTGSSSVVTSTSASVAALTVIGNSSTTAPALNLLNNPAAAVTDFNLTIDSSGAIKQSAATIQSQFILNGGQSGPLTIGTTNATGINFITNNTNYLSLLQNGNTIITGSLGIGTTAPITQLQVAQNNPVSVSSIVTSVGSLARTLAVQGRYAYVINQTAATLQVFDVSNPTAPVSLASVGTGTTPDGIAVQGRYVYIVNFSSGTLQIFDISNPFAPLAMNGTGTATGANPAGVYVQGRYAYVINFGGNTLQVFDVSNPTAPVVAGTLTIPGATPGPYAIYVQGRYAYITNFTTATLAVIDISNPAAPTQINGAGTTTRSQPNAVYAQGRYVYVVSRSGNSFQIFDVENPASPVLVNTTTIAAQPFAVVVQGRYAYITDYTTNTLQIFDVSTPASPVSVATVATGNNPQGVWVQGRYAYLINAADNTLQIFDLGGAYIQDLEAGSIEVGSLATRGNLTVNNDFDIRGGAVFGQGFQATGASSITTNTNASGYQGVAGLSISVGPQNAIITSAGTVSSPAYSFIGNTAAGLYAPATNQLALITSNTARLIIDSTGSVSYFSQYKMHAYPSAGQTSATGATTTISFATKSFDPQNSFVTNSYTAPLSGYYYVAAQVSYTVAATANLPFVRTLNLVKNGTALIGYGAIGFPSVQPTGTTGTTTGPFNLDTTSIVQLNQGDNLTVTWTQASGATDTLNAAGTHLDVHFLSTV